MPCYTFSPFLKACLVALLSMRTAVLAQEEGSLTGFGIVADSWGRVSGVAEGVISLVQFFDDLFPDEASGATVRLYANDEDDDAEDMRGYVSVILGFDNGNSLLGSSDRDPWMEAGDSAEVEIHQYRGEASQSQYIDIMAADDEVCIQYIRGVTQPDGQKDFWTGDIGANCGQTWDYGYGYHGTKDGQRYYPACVWMDTDNGEDIDDPSDQMYGITLQQMKINIAAYSGSKDLPDLDYICGSTIFTDQNKLAIPEPTPRGVHQPRLWLDHPWWSDRKRSVSDEDWETVGNASSSQSDRPRRAKRQSRKMAEKLVVNSRPSQSARVLCDHPLSRGSDFASIDEGLFCDMGTKTLYPLCNDTVRVGCYDIDEHELQAIRRDGAKTALRSPPVKKYKKIIQAH